MVERIGYHISSWPSCFKKVFFSVICTMISNQKSECTSFTFVHHSLTNDTLLENWVVGPGLTDKTQIGVKGENC